MDSHKYIVIEVKEKYQGKYRTRKMVARCEKIKKQKDDQHL